MRQIKFIANKYTARHKQRLVQREMEAYIKRIRKSVDILFNEKTAYATNVAEEGASSVIESTDGNSSSILSNQNIIVQVTQEQELSNSENRMPTERLISGENDQVDINAEGQEEEESEEVNDRVCFNSDELELEYRYSDEDNDGIDCDDGENSKASKWKNILEVSMEKVCNEEGKNGVSLIKKFRVHETESQIISKQLKSLLPRWQVSSNIQTSDMTKLLHKIREEVPLLELPLDGRTLIKTPRHTVTYPMGGGEYHHFGLLSCLTKIVTELRRKGVENNTIELFINVDGAPVGKSSSKDLWPILCCDKLIKKVHIIGVFYGPSKPEDANEYLTFFVDEAAEYVTNGITVDDIHYNILIDEIICDVPAKAYILGVKYHSGYSSCTKCNIKGISRNGVCFPGGVAEPRTDEKFNEYAYAAEKGSKRSDPSNNSDSNTKDQDGYQVRKSVLTKIPKLGLVTQVPLDPMHLVFLGLVRKLLLLWKLSSTRLRLPVKIINTISGILIALAAHVPCEFVRKPRHLKDLKLFKATEFRQTSLYTRVVTFKGHVRSKVYKNFLILHVVITIFSNPYLAKDKVWVDYAEMLSKKFVEQFADIYGNRYVSHNVHSFQHLADDVCRYGDLEKFAAFNFESCISQIKRYIRGKNKPLQQLARRCKEVEILQDTPIASSASDVLRQQHTQGPLTSNFSKVTQYKVRYFDEFKLNCSDDKNNYVIVDNIHVVRVLNIVVNCDDKKTYLIGQELKIIGPVYTYLCLSSRFGINIVHESLNADYNYWNVKSVNAKLFKMPFEGNLAVFPILHTLRRSVM